MKLTTILPENIVHRKAEAGSTDFNRMRLTDPGAQELIKKVSALTGVPTENIVKAIMHEQDVDDEIAAVAPDLFETMKDRVVEKVLFQIIEKARKVEVEGSPKFSYPVFLRLRSKIHANHRNVWPLRGFIQRKPPANPQFYLTGYYHPDTGEYVERDDPTKPATPMYGVNTAAAMPSGSFIFNVKFMQRLLDYATIKNIQPKQPYYSNNGGEIPYQYAYIEFLILHEYYHYCDEDFYYQHMIPGAQGKIINWVGDLRTNYTLVKSGYVPLPIGLYSDRINFDRQGSYKEMYNKVHAEFEAIKKLQESKQSGGGQKQPIKVGDKVRMPDGKPGVVTSINGDRATVDPI